MSSAPDTLPRDSVLEDLPFHLVRTALAFRRFSDHTLKAVGLKPQAPGIASLLHALVGAEYCTVNELVQRTHLPNGTLTGLLDTLETARYIERVRNPADGRSWRIRLTKSGRKLCAKLDRRHRLVMEIFGEALSDAEAMQLKQLLGKLTARMREYRAKKGTPS